MNRRSKLAVLTALMMAASLMSCEEDDDCDKGPLKKGNVSYYDADGLVELEGHTEVWGSLSISNFDGASIKDLSALSCMKIVHGNFDLFYLRSLTDLSGLDKLEMVGGSLDISDNSSLNSLNGLGNLEEISGNLAIYQNDALVSMEALSDLTSIGLGLSVEFNDAVPSCQVCDLLDQLSNYPKNISVNENLVDECYDGTEFSCP